MLKFLTKNYFLTIFFLCIAFVGVVSLYKLKGTKPQFVYVKVRLGQGLWWTGGAKPNIWFVNALKKASIEKDLLGAPITQILSVRYYPYWGSDQYDVYLYLKLKVTKRGNPPKYLFKRSTLGVSSPIELEFPTVQATGTIIDLNSSEIEDKLVEKEITLTKFLQYPWEYQAIKVGSKYNDGKEDVLEITDKNISNLSSLGLDILNISGSKIAKVQQYVIVKAKIKLREVDNQYIYGEDQRISIGKTINLSTPEFTFADYIVGEIK